MKNGTIEKAIPSMDKLSNQYSDIQKEIGLKKKVIVSRMKQASQKMKDAVTQMQLGDDSRVDEALMISFFSSLFDDINKAYLAYKELRLERKIQKLDEFKEHTEKVSRYTELNIERNVLEKKILELKQVQAKNNESGTVEITDQDELGDAEKRLAKVVKEIDGIANFYEHKSNAEFMEELEKLEEKYYGDDAAMYLKAVRERDKYKVNELVKNIDAFPGDKNRVRRLEEAWNAIDEYCEQPTDPKKGAALVFEFQAAVTSVQAVSTITKLAKEGEEIAQTKDDSGKKVSLEELN